MITGDTTGLKALEPEIEEYCLRCVIFHHIEHCIYKCVISTRSDFCQAVYSLQIYCLDAQKPAKCSLSQVESQSGGLAGGSSQMELVVKHSK